MQAIYRIEVKYASACFLFYIYNSTTGKCFEYIIATKAVCKYECIFRNMSTKYFIKFFTWWFCLVYSSRNGVAVTLDASTDSYILIWNTTFGSLCTMFACFAACRFGNLTAFLTIKYKCFVKFSDARKKNRTIFKKIL